MTKLSNEIKAEKNDDKKAVILTHVSHIDLKKEYMDLVKEIADVSGVIVEYKNHVKKPVKKVAKKTPIKVVEIKDDE